jgi:predicted nucleic acid-binding protein
MSALTALLDTNILIELYRKNASTQAWLVSQEIVSTSRLGISSITWLEFNGRGKRKSRTGTLLGNYGKIYVGAAKVHRSRLGNGATAKVSI